MNTLELRTSRLRLRRLTLDDPGQMATLLGDVDTVDEEQPVRGGIRQVDRVVWTASDGLA